MAPRFSELAALQLFGISAAHLPLGGRGRTSPCSAVGQCSGLSPPLKGCSLQKYPTLTGWELRPSGRSGATQLFDVHLHQVRAAAWQRLALLTSFEAPGFWWLTTVFLSRQRPQPTWLIEVSPHHLSLFIAAGISHTRGISQYSLLKLAPGTL